MNQTQNHAFQNDKSTQSDAGIRPDALALVVEGVRADAVQAPAKYLKDSLVPEGGE